ncbi:MAG: SurA N-terminal domain-containing protein [Hyphomicrobiaceae bacterium]
MAIVTASLTGPQAAAQFGNGAVIVTVPQPNAAPAAKPKPRTRKKATKPKARRTATKRRQARPSRQRKTSADRLKIAVLVNDDPITQYEISQRAALLAARSGVGKRAQANFKNLIKRKSTNNRLRAILKETIQANQGRNREQILAIFERRKKAYAKVLQKQAVSMARKSVIPGLRRKATQELIDERLKLQAAKRAKVLISKAQLDGVMNGIAKRNKVSLAGFKERLRRQGTDYNTMRTRVRAQLSWGRLVNAKFGRYVDVNQKTIDESVVSGNDASKISLHLHRFLFRLPAKIDQRVIAQRMVEAGQARANFRGCATSRNLTRGAKDVSFRDMGYRVASAIAEPTRSLLLNARNGEMAPPVTIREGVALYAVCARRSGNKSFAARRAAENTLRRKHTEIYGRKYLSDLRREAHVEYRTR